MQKRIELVHIELVKEKSILSTNRRLHSPENVYELTYDLIAKRDREHLLVIGLNTKGEPTIIQLAHIGTINQSITSPREIMKPLILSNAVHFIIVHNHPSGDVTPSEADVQFTKQLIQAGKLMHILLKDHVIITDGQYVSLRECCNIPEWAGQYDGTRTL